MGVVGAVGVALCLLLTSLTRDARALPSEDLPRAWQSMCSLTISADSTKITTQHITCQVGKGDIWDFKHLRAWSNVTLPDKVIDLEVNCLPRGKIMLPWPYRTHNLRSLKITNCRNEGFATDIHRIAYVRALPDSLEYLTEINVTNILTMEALEVFGSVDVFDCGPSNLRERISLNESIDFLANHDAFVHQTGLDAIRNMSQSTHVCVYKDMETHDYSYVKDMSPSYDQLLTDNTRFPRLRTYSFRYNSQRQVPPYLTNWGLKFPEIVTVNLSHNNIEWFHFNNLKTQSGVIDLTHNKLTTLTTSELECMRTMYPVIINVSHNPFMCDCSTANFSDFLRSHGNTDAADLGPEYSDLWNLTCSSPKEREGRRLVEFSHSDLCELSDEFLLKRVAGTLGAIILLMISLLVLYSQLQEAINMYLFRRWRKMLILFPFEKKNRGSEGRSSDAFCMYAAKGLARVDYQVAFELRTKLEPNYYISMPDIDFLVGEDIGLEICTKLEDSRRFIIVLSEGVTHEETYLLFSLREAQMQALKDLSVFLFFIKKPCVDTSQLPEPFQRAMKYHRVIDYKPEDEDYYNQVEFLLAPRTSPCPDSDNCCLSLYKWWVNRETENFASKVGTARRQVFDRNRYGRAINAAEGAQDNGEDGAFEGRQDNGQGNGQGGALEDLQGGADAEGYAACADATVGEVRLQMGSENYTDSLDEPEDPFYSSDQFHKVCDSPYFSTDSDDAKEDPESPSLRRTGDSPRRAEATDGEAENSRAQREESATEESDDGPFGRTDPKHGVEDSSLETVDVYKNRDDAARNPDASTKGAGDSSLGNKQTPR